MAFIYVKKITASLGYRRRLTAVVNDDTGEVLRDGLPAQPLMRIKGRLVEGWAESAEFGDFVRWIGQFQADVVGKQGEIIVYMSRNLIMPSIVSEYLAASMQGDVRETTIKNRTGEHFSPREDFSEVTFALDLWIMPPGRPNAQGYEYDLRPILSPDMANPLDAIAADVAPIAAGLTATALIEEAPMKTKKDKPKAA